MGSVGGGSRALLASLRCRVTAQCVPLLDTKRASTTPLQRDQTEPSKRPVRGGPVSWLSLVLLMITGGGLVFYYDKEKKRHIEELKSASSSVKQGPSVGTAAIGGPFKLVNRLGKSITNKDFMGKWTLIYFGFTHCPDICPDELQKMASAIDKISKLFVLDMEANVKYMPL